MQKRISLTLFPSSNAFKKQSKIEKKKKKKKKLEQELCLKLAHNYILHQVIET